jgi:hypothetical protein
MSGDELQQAAGHYGQRWTSHGLAHGTHAEQADRAGRWAERATGSTGHSDSSDGHLREHESMAEGMMYNEQTTRVELLVPGSGPHVELRNGL